MVDPSIIEEIVSRPGWSSGNSMALIITGSGKRTAESFEGAAGLGPILHIEYLINHTASKMVLENTVSNSDDRWSSSFLSSRQRQSQLFTELNIKGELKVRLKPNPFSSELSLFIQRTEMEIKEATIWIMDINSRVVYQQKQLPVDQEHFITLQGKLPDGLYFVRV